MGRLTPGSERSRWFSARADWSAPDSMAWRRDSICDSTWARSSLRPAPTARFRSGGEGFSQLSVIWASTPDLRPSQASRKVFQADSSWMEADSSSKRERMAAMSGATCSGSVTPRTVRVWAAVVKRDSIRVEIVPSRGAACCAPRRQMRLRLFGLGWRGGFGAGYQAGKGGGVFHRDVGQDFAIERDAGSFEAVD